MAAASAALPPPARLLHRSSAVVATNPIFTPSLLVGRRHHLSPDVHGRARWQLPRYGVIQWTQFTIRYRNRAGAYDLQAADCIALQRSGLGKAAFEFGGSRIGRNRCVPLRPGAAVVGGGNFGSLSYESAEVGGGGDPFKEFLIGALRILETLKRLTIQSWGPLLVAGIGPVALAAVLAFRSSVGGVFLLAASYCATLGMAFFSWLLLVERNRLVTLLKFQPNSGKESEQRLAFAEASSTVAHNLPKTLTPRLSSISQQLAGECREEMTENTENTSSRGGFSIPEASGDLISSNSNRDSSSDDLGVDWKPDAEKEVTNISQSVAHLMNIIATSEVNNADVDSWSGVESDIQDLCLKLQSLKGTVLEKQSQLQSKQNKTDVEAANIGQTLGVSSSIFCGSKGVQDCTASKVVEDGLSGHQEEETILEFHDSIYSRQGQQQSSIQPSEGNFVTAEESSKSPPFLQVSSLSSAHLAGSGETLSVSSVVARTVSIPADASYHQDTHAADGTLVKDGLPPELVESVSGVRSCAESVVGLENSSSSGEDAHLAEFHILSPASKVLVEDHVPLSNRSSANKSTKEAQTKRSSSPDPWRTDSTIQASERVSARGDGREVLDLILIVNENSKAGIPREDSIGTSGGINSHGNVDFWGKNAGSITKTNDQRGTLTKIKATGNNVGLVDDFDDDRERGRRRSLEEEQRQPPGRDLPGYSRGGQPWDGQQLGAPARETIIDDPQLWRDAGSAGTAPVAADDFGRSEGDIRSPQTLRRNRDFENGPLVNKEMPVDGGAIDADGDASESSRFGSSQQTIRSGSSYSVPYNPQVGEGRSTATINDDSSIRGETKGVNQRNYAGSNNAQDVPPNPDGKVYRGPVDPQDGRSTPDPSLEYARSQSETTERNYALQQSEQAQTTKFDRYLDEAEALMEEGMQGLEGRIEVGVAERMLYEAASLLESAAKMYPTDLTAVGQWGNTLLIHGELKLKLSQQLRSMLPATRGNLPLSKSGGPMADREQESMESTLQEVCEECEELLVDAGRKYRRALSLDKSDVRALYNWGLALCYRGQLISEEGGERAMQDADKVYLAAIDKFEAMLGISKDYAAGGTAALLNWGLAMRDRSRLRDMGDKERVQLLLQAKDLFQDAVRLDPNYGQARGAVAACSAELKELQGYEALQRQDVKEKPPRSWWQKGG